MVQTGKPHFRRKTASSKAIELPKVTRVPTSATPSEFSQLMQSNMVLANDKIEHQKRVSELKFKNRNSIKRNTMSGKKSYKIGSSFSKKSLYKKNLSKENVQVAKLSSFNSHHTNHSSDQSSNSVMFKIEKDNENSKRLTEESKKRPFEKTSDVKAQVLISGFSQKFGVSKFDSGYGEAPLKENQVNESSFEEPEELSEEGRL